MNSSPLNEKECFLVIHSLDELYAFLRKNGSRDRSLSRSAVSQNLSAILSAKTKLRALPANASADFRRRSSRSFTGPCTKCGMRFILSLSKCRSLRRSAAKRRNLSRPATDFSACSLIFLRRLVSKSNRCFKTREICPQQSDQPCCICTAEVPASAVLLFASLHLLHAPFPLPLSFYSMRSRIVNLFAKKKMPDRRVVELRHAHLEFISGHTLPALIHRQCGLTDTEFVSDILTGHFASCLSQHL